MKQEAVVADSEEESKQVPEKVDAMPVPAPPTAPVLSPQEIKKRKKHLLQEYHDGFSNLRDKLKQGGYTSIEDLVMALVDEVIRETDHLLGNELVMEEQGNLGDASVVSFKRAEVIEKAIKAIRTKQLYEKEGRIDANSPSMRVVFKYFMGKVKYVFEKLQYPEEASDTFFRFLAEAMDGWQKELQEEIDEEVAKA
jgi:hypothetical protein